MHVATPLHGLFHVLLAILKSGDKVKRLTTTKNILKRVKFSLRSSLFLHRYY